MATVLRPHPLWLTCSPCPPRRPNNEAAYHAQHRIHRRDTHTVPQNVHDQAYHVLLLLHWLGSFRGQDRVRRCAQSAPGRIICPQQPISRVTQGSGAEAAGRSAIALDGILQWPGRNPTGGVHPRTVVQGRSAAHHEPHCGPINHTLAPVGGCVPGSPAEEDREVGTMGEDVGRRLDRDVVVSADVSSRITEL
jgi:hypothetical protein